MTLDIEKNLNVAYSSIVDILNNVQEQENYNLSDTALLFQNLKNLQKRLNEAVALTENRLISFSNSEKFEGVENLNLDRGWKVKVSKKLNRTVKISLADAQEVNKELGLNLFDSDIKVKMSKRVYDSLSENNKIELSEYIIEKPGKTNVEIVEPKL